ncbi:MAG: hypothetical protein M3R49_04240 [Chloroflexota bacterium]|nr:hypothetical protein [Chloroflexota bacterium]
MTQPATPRPGRTLRIVRAAALAAYVVAGAGLVGLITVGLFFWVGQPWGVLSDVVLLVMTLALAPLMLAFYELGGRTPTPLAQAAQVLGWTAVLTWCLVQALVIAGVVVFDESVSATAAFAIECAALVLIGLWVAGANLLAGPWLRWVRWLGVGGGIGFVLFAIGLLRGGLDQPLTYVGGIGYLIIFPVWAFLMARELRASPAGPASG